MTTSGQREQEHLPSSAPGRAAADRRHPIRPATATYLVVIALFIVAALAASVTGGPVFAPAQPRPLPEPSPQPSRETPGVGGPLIVDENQRDAILIVVGVIIAVIVTTLVVAALALLLRHLLRMLARRRTQQAAPPPTELASSTVIVDEQAEDAPLMRRGIAAARRSILAHRAPGDAIIAAWVGLEQTAEDSGAGRGRSETPSEFALRILQRRPGIGADAQQLLGLYEQVRFGGRRADEDMRARAAQALERIEEGWR